MQLQRKKDSGRKPKFPKKGNKSSLAKNIKNIQKDAKENGKQVKLKKKSLVKSERPIVETPEEFEKLYPRGSKTYVEIKVTGTKGKVYTVVIPAAYASHVPRKWRWTKERYRAAELIAQGIATTEVIKDPDISIKSHTTIYGWLEHPEFKEHVEGLIYETGFASKRERIAGISRLTEKLYNKIINDLDTVNLKQDKYALNALLTGINQTLKLLSQEKEELVEQTKVEQTTTLSGGIGVVSANVTKVLDEKTEEEKKQLEAEFDKMGDSIIRSITGE